MTTVPTAPLRSRSSWGCSSSSTTVITVVLEELQPQLLRDLNGAVGTVVIHQDANVHQIRHLAHGSLERLLRVVSGQHYRDALAVNHFEESMERRASPPVRQLIY